MTHRFKLCRLSDYFNDRQEVFAVVVQGRRTPGIVSHWRGKYAHMGWLAFRGTGLSCKFIKGGLAKRQAIDIVLNAV